MKVLSGSDKATSFSPVSEASSATDAVEATSVEVVGTAEVVKLVSAGVSIAGATARPVIALVRPSSVSTIGELTRFLFRRIWSIRPLSRTHSCRRI